jgi:valyl-tRNA synthetase
MSLEKSYPAGEREQKIAERWAASRVYRYAGDDPQKTFAIDTPPPTVSGYLHLGHVYSYSQIDFMARFWRMNGRDVFFPLGFDDNGLPTEKLVQRLRGIRPEDVGRAAFIQACLEVSEQTEVDYRALWQRLGLSVDWRYTYRTIDEASRRTSQSAFLDLYKKGYIYRKEAPTIWCPECRTAIAQAELNDLERASEFVTLAFRLENGGILPIATTRAELLPACVAVFVHPEDARFKDLVGSQAASPLDGRKVPILADARADPQKGSGAVMCCTFGDSVDVEWWYTHHLPLLQAIDRTGRMTALAGDLEGLTTREARQKLVARLEDQGKVIGRNGLAQTVRVHERCDTPIETIVTPQWFVRVLEFKDQLLKAGERIEWHPEHMLARYTDWVANLNWDWCISRQRYFGVSFPVWYCAHCGEVRLAEESQLPVDPSAAAPLDPCACGSREWTPEMDVMDTWMTSSMSPQIAGRRLDDSNLYAKVFPFALRTQAHEIIRTWAFYTVVKSTYLFGEIPWKATAISGWGLAPEGGGKISKSRGGGPMAPMALIERYSADAARYWAASTAFGRDAVISEEKVQAGQRLVVKLWNAARFAERFISGDLISGSVPALSPGDRWILARLQTVVRRANAQFREYDYSGAKAETESFFWDDLADNYIEMAKQRLYGERMEFQEGARYSLAVCLKTTLLLLAPILPYITEEIYQGLFAAPGEGSIHRAAWPEANPALEDLRAEEFGSQLVAIASGVRRYKSERGLPLGSKLSYLELAVEDEHSAAALVEAIPDLASITRAERIEVSRHLSPIRTSMGAVEDVEIGIGR